MWENKIRKFGKYQKTEQSYRFLKLKKKKIKKVILRGKYINKHILMLQ